MIKRLISASMLSIALLMPVQALADTPLVVIRFNQRQVNYQQMLYSAVSRAVEANPDVMFDLVVSAPRGEDAYSSGNYADIANARGNEVNRSLQSMGVPASRISQRSEGGSESGSPEVRIFVH